MFHPLCPALTVLHPRGGGGGDGDKRGVTRGKHADTMPHQQLYSAPAPDTGSANQSRGYKPNPFSGLLPLINRPNKLHGGEVHLLPKQQQ